MLCIVINRCKPYTLGAWHAHAVDPPSIRHGFARPDARPAPRFGGAGMNVIQTGAEFPMVLRPPSI